MLALRLHHASLCPGCGQPKATAWHSDMDGWFDVDLITCHACTRVQSVASGGADSHPKEYAVVTDTRDYVAKPLPENRRPRRGG